MMRVFGEADKQKKAARIKTPPNPAGLSDEVLSRLADAVRATLHEGSLPCGSAFKIARDADVPRLAVGDVTDRLGIRVSNCQIGCFKVDKIINDSAGTETVDEAVLARVEALKRDGALTCANIFALAQQLKAAPMAVAKVANARNLKVRGCQLGCF
jgi:hypothetical protein